MTLREMFGDGPGYQPGIRGPYQIPPTQPGCSAMILAFIAGYFGYAFIIGGPGTNFLSPATGLLFVWVQTLFYRQPRSPEGEFLVWNPEIGQWERKRECQD